MPDLVTRWPYWYLILVAYTAWISISELRRQRHVSTGLQDAATASSSPGERARAQGQRVGGWVRAATWFVCAVLLLGGWTWARVFVALGYAISARRSVIDFARGAAEGRKSAELASAHEYVRGRVSPQAADYLLANGFTLVTRGIPLAAVTYSIIALPR